MSSNYQLYAYKDGVFLKDISLSRDEYATILCALVSEEVVANRRVHELEERLHEERQEALRITALVEKLPELE